MNAAVIIETRSGFVDAIKKHLSFLSGWKLIILGSDENKEEILKEFNCSFVNLKSPLNIHLYNKLLVSKLLWNYLMPFERVLIFQHDSALLKEIDKEFLNYDYVGAPWKFQLHGGNGGLSIRNPKKHLEVIDKFPFEEKRHGNEDVYFSNHLELVGGLIAPRSVCEKFSCESIFRLGTTGYHAIDKYLTKSECLQIKNQYHDKLQIQKRVRKQRDKNDA